MDVTTLGPEGPGFWRARRIKESRLLALIQIKPPREYRRQDALLLRFRRCRKRAPGSEIPMPPVKSFAEAAVLARLTWFLSRVAASCAASRHRIYA